MSSVLRRLPPASRLAFASSISALNDPVGVPCAATSHTGPGERRQARASASTGAAKGGFVLKRPPSDADGLGAEVVECYRAFISGLLDLTDNLVSAPGGGARPTSDSQTPPAPRRRPGTGRAARAGRARAAARRCAA